MLESALENQETSCHQKSPENARVIVKELRLQTCRLFSRLWLLRLRTGLPLPRKTGRPSKKSSQARIAKATTSWWGTRSHTPKAILTLFQSGQLPPWSADWLWWSPCPSLLPASPSPHAWALAPWPPGQCNLATRYSSHGWRHCNCLDFSGTVLESWERTRTVRCSWINQSRQVSKPLQMCYSYVPEREQHKSKKTLLAFCICKGPSLGISFVTLLCGLPGNHSSACCQFRTRSVKQAAILVKKIPSSWALDVMMNCAGGGGRTRDGDGTFQKGKKKTSILQLLDFNPNPTLSLSFLLVSKSKPKGLHLTVHTISKR